MYNKQTGNKSTRTVTHSRQERNPLKTRLQLSPGSSEYELIKGFPLKRKNNETSDWTKSG